jgi:hypothetical protein
MVLSRGGVEIGNYDSSSIKSFLSMLTLTASLLLASCGSMPGASPGPGSSSTTYMIGGTVINLAGTGGGLHLQDNGGDTLLVNANGNFTFPAALAIGSAYNVTVSEQPTAPAQKCEVTRGSGTATTNVTNIAVDCGHGEWVWSNGANVANQTGIYGTQGTAAAGNVPGSRYEGAAWTDAGGNLWLFGGSGAPGIFFNDLWKYSAGQWSWMGGTNGAQAAGTYGTRGTAAPGNVPGGRIQSVTWTDATGNFWLFGGYGFDSTGQLNPLNDLWKYGGGEWTWIGGSNAVSQVGTYGTMGTAAPGNVPGAREAAVSWTDPAGNFWLFGGSGFDSVGGQGLLNDLWKYSGGQWAWMGGSNIIGQQGTYGTKGMAAPNNVPGGRDLAVGWADTMGNFWLFGGNGYLPTAVAPFTNATGYLNDLWRYSAGQWAWMGGPNIPVYGAQLGTYGTRGMASPSNIPGGRQASVSWTDAGGNLWLFGGYGYDTGAGGFLDDLWMYSGGEWTWVSGLNAVNQIGTYGTQGTASPNNTPVTREGAVAWPDATGNFWIFGGLGYDPTANASEGWLNDLWKYEP